MATKKGPKQTEVPGTEREYDEDISAAVETMKKLRMRRTKLKEQYDGAVDRLKGLMRAKNMKTYFDPELEAKVTITEGTKLSLIKFVVKDGEE